MHPRNRIIGVVPAFVLALALALAVLPARAANYTLSTDQDSWMKEDSPSENHGSDSELSTKGTSGDEMRAIYRFDLSSVPANATVSSATLSLWVSGKDDSGNALDVHRVTANWTENGVRWVNTAGDFDSTVTASFTAPNDDEFTDSDITALVQSWLCGDYSNHGIVIHSNSTEEAKFTSEEWSTSSERPKLTVVTSSDTGGCSPAANHFSISHDASAATCAVENITIAQHDGSHVIDTSYTGTITLSTSTANGDWSLVTGSGSLTNSGNGSATYAYVGGDSGSVVLGLLNSNAETLNIDVTDGSVSEDVSEDSSLTFTSTSAATFRDEFNSVSYSGSNGTNSWATDWLEINESNGASSGDERVTSDASDNRLRVKDNDGGGEGVQRELDLSGYTSATLSFIYRRRGLDNSSDYVTVDVSADGGSTWTELDRLQGSANDASYLSASYDISSYIAANTRIRFLSSSSLGNSDRVYFDNVEISADTGGCVIADHFAITHSGTSSTCSVESVIITVQDNSDATVTDYTGTLTLSTSTGNGDWQTGSGGAQGTLTPGAADSGTATYSFVAGDSGQVTLEFLDTNQETVNINLSDGSISESGGTDPNLTVEICGDTGGVTCATWAGSNWPYRKSITIDSGKVTASLGNFPVLVSLTDADLAASAQADADDIWFSANDGITQLDHEIEDFDSATGTLVAWVRAPTLSSSSDDVIYMYYGNASASDQSNATGVWDSNYAMVLHLHDDFLDSTLNTNHATNSSTADSTGKIADGQDFDGSNDYLTPGANAVGQSEVTLSFWVNADETVSTNTIYDEYYNQYWQFSVLQNKFYTRDSSNAPSGTRNNDVTWGPLTTGWHHVALRYSVSGSIKAAYLDGQLEASSTNSIDVLSSNRTGTRIGWATDGSDFDGDLDEIRLSLGIARSADWITTEYNNQNSPATFYSLSLQQTPCGSTGHFAISHDGNLRVVMD